MDVQFHLLLTVKDITGLLFLHLASKSFKIEFRAKIRAPIRATFTEGLGSCSPSLAQTCVGPWSGTLSYWDQKHPTLDCVRFLLILDLYIYIQYIYIHSIYIYTQYIYTQYIYIYTVYIYTVYIYTQYIYIYTHSVYIYIYCMYHITVCVCILNSAYFLSPCWRPIFLVLATRSISWILTVGSFALNL